MEKLLYIMNKDERLVAGLMSGTSLDGLDVALMQIKGNGIHTQVRLLDFQTYPYEEPLRTMIMKCCENHGSTEEICKMNFILGEVFAKGVLDICKANHLPLSALDLVGSHGQTIYHVPGSSTLQIGEPAVIAERTGAVTVADFRVRDIAAGGEGAPLVPYTEYLLYRHPCKTRILQNIGGIGNATVMPADAQPQDVFAFDTGPGNMMIDCCTALMTDGREHFDKDGSYAAQGKVYKPLLEELMQHPFIRQQPPKTTGREMFGEGFTRELVARYRGLGMSYCDLLATLTLFTAKSISSSYQQFILNHHRVDEVIIAGGGSHNHTLLSMLQKELGEIPVITQEQLGFSSDAKEAVAFGILANEVISGNPNNLQRVTGAKHQVIMGKISL